MLITVFNTLERVCSKTQLCQLGCLITILDNYMLRPLLAIFRLSFREVKVLLYIYRVSQEECARLRESVPYVKVYRYNQNTYIQS